MSYIGWNCTRDTLDCAKQLSYVFKHFFFRESSWQRTKGIVIVDHNMQHTSDIGMQHTSYKKKKHHTYRHTHHVHHVAWLVGGGVVVVFGSLLWVVYFVPEGTDLTRR